MRSGYVYLAATVAIGVIGAVFIAFAYPYPVIMMFFTAFGLLLPFVVFLYLGVLELVWGNRFGGGGGPERGEELVPVADVVEFAGNTHPLGPHRPDELPTQPRRKAA